MDFYFGKMAAAISRWIGKCLVGGKPFRTLEMMSGVNGEKTDRRDMKKVVSKDFSDWL